MQILENLTFLMKAVVKFRVLQISKILKSIQTELFQYLSSSFTYLWVIHSLKSNSAGSRSGCLSVVNQTIFPTKLFSLTRNQKKSKSITRNFMLNTTMENKNKRFTCISIPFLTFYNRLPKFRDFFR